MSSRANIAVLVMSTSACGVLAFSTDDLSSGRGGDGGVTTQGLPDAQSALDGAPLPGDERFGGDGGPVTPPPPDAGADTLPPSLGCPANACPTNSVCCYVAKGSTSGEFVCQQACADGQPVECVGPQQCGPTANICCGTVRFGAGALPNCAIDALSSRCSDKCVTNWGLSCNVTNTMRLCHEKADCSDPEYGNCCTYSGSGISAIVCVSDVIRDFGNLSCLQ